MHLCLCVSCRSTDSARCVVVQLTNLQGSIREATCVAIATMFGDISDEEQEKRMREKLLKMVDAGLLKKLIPRMVDPLKMVRLYAIGAIRCVLTLCSSLEGVCCLRSGSSAYTRH